MFYNQVFIVVYDHNPLTIFLPHFQGDNHLFLFISMDGLGWIVRSLHDVYYCKRANSEIEYLENIVPLGYVHKR